MKRILVMADDLSGAAETAAALSVRHAPALHLWPSLPDASTAVAVIDIDSRQMPAEQAHKRVKACMDARTAATPILKKVDSLLRGNVAAETAPLLTGRTPVLFCPALPEHARTVVDGILLVDGVPLDQTALWQLEGCPPPAAVRDVLPGLPVHELNLAAVRSAELPQTLAACTGRIILCDAENADDLAVLTRAALTLPDVRLVGSSALARTLGAHLEAAPSGPSTCVPPGAATVLHVLGSGAQGISDQLTILQQTCDVEPRQLSSTWLANLDAQQAADTAADVAKALDQTSIALHVAPDVSPLPGERIVAGLATLVAHVHTARGGRPLHLMLTGGQTARAVLDTLGIHHVTLVHEVHPGAVVMRTDDGSLIATRPGSHGSPQSLAQIHRAMQNINHEQENR